MDRLRDCSLCPRLSAYRSEQKRRYPDYACRPVAGFGDDRGPLLVVGLAPGLHGANASGRPFTGDASGDTLFSTLHRFGFASHPNSRGIADDMRLLQCRITNAVKCVPPQNRPRGSEISQCNRYLKAEIATLRSNSVVLALGGIAHRSIIKAMDLAQKSYRFAHLAEYVLPGGIRLIDSYHCRRYNLNTGRLNQELFDQVFHRIRQILR